MMPSVAIVPLATPSEVICVEPMTFGDAEGAKYRNEPMAKRMSAADSRPTASEACVPVPVACATVTAIPLARSELVSRFKRFRSA